MSINRKAAYALIARFSALRGYPDTSEALGALVDALAKASADEAHARHVVEDLEVGTAFCPTPAEVWRVANATRPQAAFDVREIRCKRCGDSGWIESTTRIPNPLRGQGEPETRVFTGVRRCECQAVTASVARDEDLLL